MLSRRPPSTRCETVPPGVVPSLDREVVALECTGDLARVVLVEAQGCPDGLDEELLRSLPGVHTQFLTEGHSIAEIRRLLRSAQLLIAFSNRDHRGLLLEAMDQMRPVIASSLDPGSDVVSDGETGLLVNPASNDTIVTAATRILSDARRCREMGTAARVRLLEHFSHTRMAAVSTDAYRPLLG
jgi:glycosyltransferase involved in cell wall biosynthesis